MKQPNPTDMTPCSSPNTIAEFVGGAMHGGQRERIEMHLDECENCRKLVGRLIAFDGSPKIDDDESLVPGAKVAHYVILRAEGAGAMGTVYCAYDTQLDRNVALKFLHIRVANERQTRRLRDEAKALAKLSHTHVVSVYEVAQWQERDYVAMEYVAGQPLSTWLHAEPRSWQRILEVFCDAGRGLAAAHQAGLVHRDFKPSNVLVGADLRVCVVDFGLSLQLGAVPIFGEDNASPLLRSTKRTQTGTILGTPLYMAPEQRLAGNTDARADQYSFCVALGEALFGLVPNSTDATELQPFVDAAKKSDVPAALLPVLLRGLSQSPLNRYGSMNALLEALEEAARPTDNRRRWVTGIVVATGMAMGLWAWTKNTEEAYCTTPQAELQQVWNANKRAVIDANFSATGLPYAQNMSTLVGDTFDTYGVRWQSARREVCEATHVYAIQSDRLLDQRMACLELQRNHWDVLVTTLMERTDKDMVDLADGASAGLLDPKRCQNQALDAVLPVPTAFAAQVDTMNTELASVDTLQRLGAIEEALEKAEALWEEMREVPYKPLHAELQYMLSLLYTSVRKYPEAEAAAQKSLLLAAEIKDDNLRALVAVRLVLIAADLGQHELAMALSKMADAAVARIDNPPVLRSRWHGALAFVLATNGKVPLALEHFQQSVDLLEGSDNAVHILTGLFNIGNAHQNLGHQQEALAAYERALKISKEYYGEEHPMIGSILNGIGDVYFGAANIDQAQSYYELSLKMKEKFPEPGNISLSYSLYNMSRVHRFKGQYEDAVDFATRSYEIRKAVYPANHPILSNALVAIVEAMIGLERFTEAEEYARLAWESTVNLAPESQQRVVSILAVAMALDNQQQYREALQHYSSVVNLVDVEGHEYVPDFPVALSGVGRMNLSLGRHETAVVYLQRQLDLYETTTDSNPDPYSLAECQFYLAVALGKSKQRPLDALKLMTAAKDGYAALPEVLQKSKVAEASRWISRHK